MTGHLQRLAERAVLRPQRRAAPRAGAESQLSTFAARAASAARGVRPVLMPEPPNWTGARTVEEERSTRSDGRPEPAAQPAPPTAPAGPASVRPTPPAPGSDAVADPTEQPRRRASRSVERVTGRDGPPTAPEPARPAALPPVERPMPAPTGRRRAPSPEHRVGEPPVARLTPSPRAPQSRPPAAPPVTERPRVDLTSRQQAAAPEQIALPLRRTAVTVAARPTPYRRRQPASTTEPAPVVVRIGRVELVVERQQPTAPPPQPARTAPEPPGHPDLLAARRRYAEPGWR